MFFELFTGINTTIEIKIRKGINQNNAYKKTMKNSYNYRIIVIMLIIYITFSLLIECNSIKRDLNKTIFMHQSYNI